VSVGTDVGRVGVVIPTRDRPASLQRCLTHVAAARGDLSFTAWVCDSSRARSRLEVEAVCNRYPWVRLHTHNGTTIGAARNACVHVAESELLVSVDDDVEIEPDAVAALVRAYDAGTGPRVIAGSIMWGDNPDPTGPMVLRRIGYGRTVRSDERADFLNSSFFLYPRAFGVCWPWSERIRRASDVLMGAIWRRAGVQMLWAPEARARHEARDMLTADLHDDYVYALLAHALIPRLRPDRVALIETLTLAAALRRYAGDPRSALALLSRWRHGHAAFARDYRDLREVASRPGPQGVARGASA
jgi:glycosyltransferase involved in cell wall biosynthesis